MWNRHARIFNYLNQLVVLTLLARPLLFLKIENQTPLEGGKWSRTAREENP